jgi:uncharacterized membrane protein YfcA
METEKRFWTRMRVRAVLWTFLPGVLGGPLGRVLSDPGSFLALLSAAGIGGILGGLVAVFAFVFPKSEDDPSRWGKWATGSFVAGLAAGAVAGLLRKQGALH